jgi:Type-IV b secretion system, inner-membrane complex component
MLKILFSLILLVPAAFALDLPPYARIAQPSCTCSCNDRIIFAPKVLNERNVSAWAREAVHACFDYGFGNYTAALTEASQYFSQVGWDKFLAALVQSKNLDIMLAQDLITSTHIKTKPQITKLALSSNSKQSWEVKVPVLVEVSNSRTTLRKPLLITLRIMQIMPISTTQSLAIEQLKVSAQAAKP